MESRLIVRLHMVDEDFAWRLAQDLVKIDSSDPGAYEGEIEYFIKRLIEQRLAQFDFQDFSPLAAQRPALNHPLRGWRQTALQSHPSDRY